MRLLGSEIRRLTSRRLVRWMLLVSSVLVLVLVAIVAAYSREDAANPNDIMAMTQLWLTRGAAVRLGVPRDNVLPTISVLVYLLLVVLGASAVGAEYRAGTVTTILTWEPRRIRLLVARLVAAGIVAMLFFLIVHLVFIGGWWLGSELRGTSAGTDSEFWQELVAVMARATVIAGALAVISGAIATMGKNTAAAMGVWFGYLIAIEAILRSQIEAVVPWLLTGNVGAFYGWESVTQNGYTVAAEAGGLRLALYVVVLGAAAVVVFRRRDVT